MQSVSFESVHSLILDMDGVLWRGDQPLGNLSYIFHELGRKNYRAILATNNATRSVEQYLAKLSGFGVTLESWQVINSSEATADYLHQKYPRGGPVYVIGETGLIQALNGRGFCPVDFEPQTGLPKDVLAVVAGMDRGLTYEKLSKATLLIRAGAPFIATNPDRTFPTPQGLVPGAGAILAALEAATDVSPTIIGKPFPEMYRVALDRLGALPEETLVVGDRLETDIAGAQGLGCRTALVLSGVTSLESASQWKPAPDLVISDLTALVEML